MKTFDQTRDEYCQSHGFRDFEDYCNSLTLNDDEYQEIAEIYAKQYNPETFEIESGDLAIEYYCKESEQSGFMYSTDKGCSLEKSNGYCSGFVNGFKKAQEVLQLQGTKAYLIEQGEVISKEDYLSYTKKTTLQLLEIADEANSQIGLGKKFVTDQEIDNMYKVWCKKTKRSGGILIGKSILEFCKWMRDQLTQK